MPADILTNIFSYIPDLYVVSLPWPIFQGRQITSDWLLQDVSKVYPEITGFLARLNGKLFEAKNPNYVQHELEPHSDHSNGTKDRNTDLYNHIVLVQSRSFL